MTNLMSVEKRCQLHVKAKNTTLLQILGVLMMSTYIQGNVTCFSNERLCLTSYIDVDVHTPWNQGQTLRRKIHDKFYYYPVYHILLHRIHEIGIFEQQKTLANAF